MGEEDQYITVRIPRFFDGFINKYIEKNQEELRLLGQRISRASIVKRALYEFLRKEGIVEETSTQLKIQEDLLNLAEGFLVNIKETFLMHSIIKIAKESALPSTHLNLQEFEQNIREYIIKRAKKESKKIKKEQLDKLTAGLVEYHKEILDGLALIRPEGLDLDSSLSK